ncbi:MAG: hypothetical protein IPH57_08690 [Saprospiraceae bacterium]|nr:hypothetical protein [Saprospiraceae bacterium]
MTETSDRRGSSKTGDKAFWKWLKYGKKFEQEVILEGLKVRTSEIYKDLKDKIKKEFGNTIDLDDYDMYSQVQLK